MIIIKTSRLFTNKKNLQFYQKIITFVLSFVKQIS